MKIAAGQTASALRQSGQYAGLLIYGEDWGLVRDRARAAVRGVVGDGGDPFRLSTLTREDHGRLAAEAEGLALGGGRKVIWVQDATDALATALAKLRLRAADTLLVVETASLTPRSKLRVFAERQADWGAIPCYLGNAGTIAADIKQTFQDAGLAATPEALAFLASELDGESVTRRAELEKLILYAADEGTVDLGTAQASCVSSVETSLGAATAAALSGQVAACDALLGELEREGATGAGLLAVLSGQVSRLLRIRLAMDEGESFEQAIRSLMPPVYPRQAAGMQRDVQRWRRPALEALGRAIRDADIACKRAASPDFAIAARLLGAVAARVPGRG